MDKNILLYKNEGCSWDEALPLGNGTLGCMIYGGGSVDQIQFNMESVWAGPPVPLNKTTGPAALKESIKLLKDGEYSKAQNILQSDLLDKRISPRSYQTMGDLKIIDIDNGSVSEFSRELNLENALYRSKWVTNCKSVTRECFVPYSNSVVICKTSSSEAKSLNYKLEYSRDGNVDISCKWGEILINGVANHNGTHNGVKFNAKLKVESSDGVIRCNSRGIEVRNASDFTIIFTCVTNYNKFEPGRPLLFNMDEKLNENICSVSLLGYKSALEEHRREFSSLYNRVNLSLNSDSTTGSNTTEELFNNFGKNPSNLLVEQYFNYGRYLILSSSKEGTLCANLQGIWNKDIEAPWNADYHININIQMIYWLSELVNLPETHMPFFDYLEALVENGRKTAQEVYGLRGSVVHHTSDVWHFTAPCGDTTWGMWPLGGAWCSRHFIEHFDHTGDIRFLKNRAYPYLRECALFIYDYLVKIGSETGDDILTFGPASSPENLFYDPNTGEECNVSLGCSMGNQITRELFENLIYSAEVLNIADDFIDDVKVALGKLEGVKISTDGRVLEWDKEYKEVEVGHRHISHLYGLYPGTQFNNKGDIKMAAEATLRRRLESGGGHTGWSRAWIINMWARLGNKEESWNNFKSLITESTLPNLLDNHPPFQLDGNIGGAASVIEMIVQSNRGKVEIFPALPENFKTGSIKGISLSGGFIINMDWKDRKVSSLVVLSKNGNFLSVKIPGSDSVSMETESGKEYRLV